MNRVKYEKMIDEKLAMLKEEMIDEMMKEIEEEKEFMQVGDVYYYLTTSGNINRTTWDDDGIDKGRLEIGNIFLTEKEAEFEAERRKVIKELEKYAEPKDREWNEENAHWTYRYDFLTKEVECDWLKFAKYDGIYFESLGKAMDALEAVGEDRIKKYYLRVED